MQKLLPRKHVARLSSRGASNALPDLNPASPPEDNWDELRSFLYKRVRRGSYISAEPVDRIYQSILPLKVTSSDSFLVLGSGLGGCVTHLCDKTNAWLSVYETDDSLYKAASTLANMRGLGRKCSIKHLEIGFNPKLDRKYDKIFLNEFLHRHDSHDTRQILKIINDHLKPGGLVVVNDYFLRSEGDCFLPPYRELVNSVPNDIRVETSDELKQIIKEHKMSVRSEKDFTLDHIESIKSTWLNIDHCLDDFMAEADSIKLMKMLKSEITFWVNKITLMSQGKLHYKSYILQKHDIENRAALMSDW